jgi:hypothetical protein
MPGGANQAAARLLGLVNPKNFRISGAIVPGTSFV